MKACFVVIQKPFSETDFNPQLILSGPVRARFHFLERWQVIRRGLWDSEKQGFKIMHPIVSEKSHLPLGFSDTRSKVTAAGGSMSSAPALHTTKTTYEPNTMGKTEQGQAQVNFHKSI